MVGRALRSVVLVTALLATGCAAQEVGLGAGPEPAAEASYSPEAHATDGPTPRSRPRQDERRVTLRMPRAYTPAAPTAGGTDDYRCFVLDPGLREDAWITGTNVLPGNPDLVHHVILFRVPPEQVPLARATDARAEGPGWTCFGDAGLDPVPDIDDAPWLGAWAPGGREAVNRRGYGVELERGSRIVMQVHYNLLAGDAPDVSAVQLRLAPARSDLASLETMLLPAPVELPCRAGRDDSPLCVRAAAVADVKERFGERAGSTAQFLPLLCGPARPGPVQSCSRTIDDPSTLHGVAGHMHLLGRSIRIDVNPGTAGARTVLDIPVWDFDDQGARPVAPVALEPGDTVRVTCRHVQWLRDQLPAFRGQPDRYVVWGEGTTDEMCLGILQVTRP